MILQCDTKGGEIGKQYSAMVATLPCGRTIERVYQSAKRNEDGEYCSKGQRPYFMNINHKNIVCEDEHRNIRYEFYTMLWMLFFLYNPDKFEALKAYDGFKDIFDGKGGKIYHPGDSYITGGSACQAASIAYLVGNKCTMPLCDELVQAFEAYCKRYPLPTAARDLLDTVQLEKAEKAIDDLLKLDSEIIAQVDLEKRISLIRMLNKATNKHFNHALGL